MDTQVVRIQLHTRKTSPLNRNKGRQSGHPRERNVYTNTCQPPHRGKGRGFTIQGPVLDDQHHHKYPRKGTYGISTESIHPRHLGNPYSGYTNKPLRRNRPQCIFEQYARRIGSRLIIQFGTRSDIACITVVPAVPYCPPCRGLTAALAVS